MGHPAAASVQRPHASAVLAALQASALRLEPSLLLVPEPALHANLAWLLPVHQQFDRPKDELWQQHGPQWIATLAEAAGKTRSFRLCYRRLRVFPSLDYEILHRLPLAPAAR